MANTNTVTRGSVTKRAGLKAGMRSAGSVSAVGWTDLQMRGLNPMLKAAITLFGVVPQVNYSLGQIRVGKNGETMRLARFDKIFGTDLAAKIH